MLTYYIIYLYKITDIYSILLLKSHVFLSQFFIHFNHDRFRLMALLEVTYFTAASNLRCHMGLICIATSSVMNPEYK